MIGLFSGIGIGIEAVGTVVLVLSAIGVTRPSKVLESNRDLESDKQENGPIELVNKDEQSWLRFVLRGRLSNIGFAVIGIGFLSQGVALLTPNLQINLSWLLVILLILLLLAVVWCYRQMNIFSDAIKKQRFFGLIVDAATNGRNRDITKETEKCREADRQFPWV
jgi:hypothetical protein